MIERRFKQAELMAREFVRGHRRKLLVVDDEPINIHYLYNIFSADYDIFMARDGEEALALCVSQAPDLVLLDIEMPGINGFEVCRRLKANPETVDIPVIFVTAHIDEASEALGLDVGAVDFIHKPTSTQVICARVKTQITLKIQSDLLRNLVYFDGLTSVYNRRYFDERLQTEWSRSIRNGSPLSLVIIDVDFFKRFNDFYGHQAGDDCLRRVAACIKANIKRPADIVARYGGEEFVCLLPETPESGAVQFAEMVRQSIVNLAIVHEDSTVHSVVTASFGVGCKPQGYTGNAEVLIKQADVQLYSAKEHGRNQICSVSLE